MFHKWYKSGDLLFIDVSCTIWKIYKETINNSNNFHSVHMAHICLFSAQEHNVVTMSTFIFSFIVEYIRNLFLCHENFHLLSSHILKRKSILTVWHLAFSIFLCAMCFNLINIFLSFRRDSLGLYTAVANTGQQPHRLRTVVLKF